MPGKLIRTKMGHCMKISEALGADNVFLDVAASSKPAVLAFLAAKAGAALGISSEDIYDALQNREALGSTGMGSGIAIPHAQTNGIVQPFALMAKVASPIDFEAIDEEPVDVVCLILTPLDEQSRHLSLLSLFARQLRSPEVVRAISSATEGQQIFEAMTSIER